MKVAAQVDDRPDVDGSVDPACAKVWIVVHPLSMAEFWVQAAPTVRSDGAWSLKPHIGRGGMDHGERFEIVAIANPKEDLKEGLVLTRWPEGEARSDFMLVTKVASGAAMMATPPELASLPSSSGETGPGSRLEQSQAQPDDNDESTSPQDKGGNCEIANGDIGVDARYGSGWVDLNQLTTFRAGSTLRLKVGGDAKNVLVRLLPDGKSPDQKVGVLGKYAVPEDGVLNVPVTSDRSAVTQISVHGTSRAWNVDLGAQNGPATLEEAEICVK